MKPSFPLSRHPPFPCDRPRLDPSRGPLTGRGWGWGGSLRNRKWGGREGADADQRPGKADAPSITALLYLSSPMQTRLGVRICVGSVCVCVCVAVELMLLLIGVIIE